MVLIGGGGALNLNIISMRLTEKRQTVNTRGKGETASTSGVRSSSRPRTAKRIAKFSTTIRLMAGALSTPLICVTLPSSVHVTTLRVATASARASRSP